VRARNWEQGVEEIQSGKVVRIMESARMRRWQIENPSERSLCNEETGKIGVSRFSQGAGVEGGERERERQMLTAERHSQHEPLDTRSIVSFLLAFPLRLSDAHALRSIHRSSRSPCRSPSLFPNFVSISFRKKLKNFTEKKKR